MVIFHSYVSLPEGRQVVRKYKKWEVYIFVYRILKNDELNDGLRMWK